MDLCYGDLDLFSWTSGSVSLDNWIFRRGIYTSISRGIVQENIAEPVYTKKQIAFSLSRFKNGNAEDVTYRIDLVDTFLNSVCLYDDDIVLSMNYDDKGGKITLKIVEKAVFNGGAICSSFAPPGAINDSISNQPTVLYFFKKVVAVVVEFKKKRYSKNSSPSCTEVQKP